MPTRPRTLALFLVLLLFAPGPLTAGPPADLEPLLPPESTGIVFLNLKQIVNSELFKRPGPSQQSARDSMKESLAAPDVKKLLDTLGFDPLTDLDYVLIASVPDLREPRDLFVVSGKFNREKWLAFFRDPSPFLPISPFALHREGGAVLVSVPNPWGTVPEKLWLSFLDDQRLLVSSRPETLLAAHRRAAGGEKSQLINPSVRATLAGIDERVASLVLFGVSSLGETGSGLVPGVGKRLSVAQSLAKVTSTEGDLSLTDDVRLSIRLKMEDEDAAHEMRPVVSRILRQAQQMVGLMAADEPALRPLGGLTVRTLPLDQKDIRIQIVLPQKDLQDLIRGPGRK
jgi:hypothetical protein